MRRMITRRLVSLLLGTSLALSAEARCRPVSPLPVDPIAYYQEIEGLTGTRLREALNHLIGDHVHHSYRCVWTILEELDADPARPGHILTFYTRRSIPVGERDRGGNDPDAWNREHVWPSSRGFPGTNQHAYTDVHHLRAADKSVNADRGNRDFDVGGKTHDECRACRVDRDSWEPPDEVKGDTARMLFYMDVRYEGRDGSGTGDLRLVDRINASGSRMGRLCTLLDWHRTDPVSAEERRRNDGASRWQGNRNPFIDRPELAVALWGEDCPAD